ncbi:catechol 2,3-dioxygenase-like lactoylglutathione lyase family enzyme [Rhodopseudomonas julia]|uniref:Catechol 2,3-dioxygenase-like lactoylglutathione lyase family enzyme n=1 Tax=Rhodopseudomonas julia TaxID=200617 RepID=A0ABU0C4N3_9BRAD|nr:VOC family protein [Rhodopseudomonas julia]MDQ0325473.1 catechol 2,3-dioxygenase-like lactoylglutathione lyase family enzyme [Rhodopseudomonas julia]
MIDHLGITARNFAASRLFYERALAPLGMNVVMALGKEETGGYEGAGFGAHGKPCFWVQSVPNGQVSGVHVAFAAADRAAVDAFYRAGLAAGGRDNGAPGLRPHYHPNYYGAFVLDPDGNNIEAVCHQPE